MCGFYEDSQHPHVWTAHSFGEGEATARQACARPGLTFASAPSDTPTRTPTRTQGPLIPACVPSSQAHRTRTHPSSSSRLGSLCASGPRRRRIEESAAAAVKVQPMNSQTRPLSQTRTPTTRTQGPLIPACVPYTQTPIHTLLPRVGAVLAQVVHAAAETATAAVGVQPVVVLWARARQVPLLLAEEACGERELALCVIGLRMSGISTETKRKTEPFSLRAWTVPRHCPCRRRDIIHHTSL